MHNFEFHNPVRLIFGKNTIPRIGPEAKAYGSRILLVYGGGSIKSNGVYDQVVKSLGQESLTIIEFGGIRSNPTLAELRKGIAIAKSEKIEVIVAVGGGSVIDTAKAIAGGACTDDDVWKFYLGQLHFQRALPLLAVSTMPATGSEMNCGLVLTNEETGQKLGGFDPQLFPKVSICDPTVTFSIPNDYLAYSAVDAMSHLMEGYLTHSLPPEAAILQDHYAEGVLKSIMTAIETALRNPADYESRATLMWGACLAWNGLALAGIGPFQVPNHMIEHPFSARYRIAHGAGLALVIPAWMRYAASKNPVRIARFARNVLGIDEADDHQAAIAGIRKLADWFQSIGAPRSFADGGIAKPDLDALTAQAHDIATLWGMADAYPPAAIRAILNAIPK